MARPPYLSLVEPWEREEPREIATTRVFSLHERVARSRTQPDKEGRFVYLDTGDWVNVVALTDDDQVVLVEQYRHGLDLVTLEIPGGMVDPGEEPLEAALRELKEESGYGGGRAQVIGRVSPNPAIMTNWCHTVLVEGVRWESAPRPEGTEELGVRLVPLDEIPALIGEGIIHHALVVAGFHHLAVHRG